MKPISDQLRQVFRRLIRAPLFTIITLITLAAGIGANTVVFGVLEGVLLKPLPYPHAQELVGVWHTAPGLNMKEVNMAPSNYFIYREQGQTFQDIGIYQDFSVSVTGLAEPEQVRALGVCDGILPLLGIPAMLGRWFTRQDDSPGVSETAIITYGYWRRKFGGSASAVGQRIIVDGKAREIIGVMPARFRFLDLQDPAVILPFQLDRGKTRLGQFSYESVARLKPGVTLARANADIARMLPIVMSSFPVPEGFSIKLFQDAHLGPYVRPLKQDVIGDVGSVLWILMGSISIVLLIACANVANLLLVRVEGRRQELALRGALGASRVRIAAEMLSESVVLGLLGALFGLVLAWGGLRVLVALAPTGLPRIHDIGIDGPVLLFTLFAALLASVLFASIPIFKYSGVHLTTGIREGGRTLSQSKEQHRARNTLVVIQVGLALVLLICSGLMIRTFRALTHVHPGFRDPSQVQTLRISIPEAQIPDSEAERVIRMQEEILHRLASIPGVSIAGIGTKLPMTGMGWSDPVFVEGRPSSEGQFPPLRRFKFVSPGYFSTMGIPLIAGRELSWDETYKKIPVAMVSENVARELWSDPAAALGKRIRVSSKDEWREVVGVVGDVYDDGVNFKPTASVYWPLLQKQFEGQSPSLRRDIVYVMRTPRAGSESFLKDVRQAVWSVNPNLPLSNVHPLEYFYNRSMARTSFTLVMLAVAGSMALLLGVIGIYGVIAYSVSQRTREIGIRMALGAQRQTLTSMFVRHGLLLTSIGVGCGLAAAIPLMRLMSSLLFKVSPVDPLTYSAVSLGLVGTAFLASYLPSRRAATVDPVEALRAE